MEALEHPKCDYTNGWMDGTAETVEWIDRLLEKVTDSEIRAMLYRWRDDVSALRRAALNKMKDPTEI